MRGTTHPNNHYKYQLFFLLPSLKFFLILLQPPVLDYFAIIPIVEKEFLPSTDPLSSKEQYFKLAINAPYLRVGVMLIMAFVIDIPHLASNISGVNGPPAIRTQTKYIRVVFIVINRSPSLALCLSDQFPSVLRDAIISTAPLQHKQPHPSPSNPGLPHGHPLKKPHLPPYIPANLCFLLAIPEYFPGLRIHTVVGTA